MPIFVVTGTILCVRSIIFSVSGPFGVISSNPYQNTTTNLEISQFLRARTSVDGSTAPHVFAAYSLTPFKMNDDGGLGFGPLPGPSNEFDGC
jgi:hypothetical protein